MATDWLTYDDFSGRSGERFEVHHDGTDLALVLVATELGSEPGGPGPDGQERRQFSVIFEGPSNPVLPQATYALAHAELDELALFLVPLGRDAGGTRYEAAFA